MKEIDWWPWHNELLSNAIWFRSILHSDEKIAVILEHLSICQLRFLYKLNNILAHILINIIGL